jgi:hypothetical protein
MRIATVARLGIVALAAVLSAATAKPVQTGAAKTEKNVVLYEPRPKFNWPHRKGQTYRVVLYQLTRDPAMPRRLVYDDVNYTEKTWRPPDDLDFETRYELFIYDEQAALVTSWGFTIGYEEAKVLFPPPTSKVNSLSPEFRIAPLQYSNVVYRFEISEDPSFDKVVDSGSVFHTTSVREFAGQDNEMGTDDDVRFVPWQVSRVLKPNKTYHWRVRALYYTAEELASGVVPDPQNAMGSSEVSGTFTIPPQSGSDSLANVTQITKDSSASFFPTLSKRLDLAYVTALPDGGAEIRVAGSEVRGGVPVFDTGREEFTKSVQGSVDDHPQWDVDGEGLFFDSNRSNKTGNIWYKRRDARGYTQLTFHDTNAWFPTVSKDGNKVAYQVYDSQVRGEWSIWIVDRDGRSATELGPGEYPQFSPDGTKIAFALRDVYGAFQIWIMDVNGGNRIQITNENNNTMPTWHPNGKKLVFVSNRSGNEDIWMVEVEGVRMDQLTNYMGRDITPEITPDGRYLLFSTQRGGEVLRIWMGEMHGG